MLMRSSYSRRRLFPLIFVWLLLLLSPTSVLSVGLSRNEGSKGDSKDEASVLKGVAEKVISHSVLAGKIQPVLSKFIISRQKAALIWRNVLKGTKKGDLLFLAAVGWCLEPSIEYIYNKLVPPPVGPDLPETDDPFQAVELEEDTDETSIPEEHKRNKKFRDTILFHVIDHISQAVKIAVGIYVVDVLEIILSSIGIKYERLNQMSEVFAKMAYTLWGGWRLKIFKRYLIAKAASRKPDNLGRAKIVDHLLDALLIGTTCFFLLDILSVEMGLAVKSIFAFGSAGTLVFSLASKDLASQVVNGLALGASDKFYEGDEVRFGDGTSGVVVSMGWMETTVRTPDELMIAIPNSQLANQRLVNLSRADKCRVTQTLRFRYEDADKLPAVLDDILSEIKESCPALITDGTRPFRAHWRDYQDNYLEVVVDCHFDLRPTGTVYWENKQKVLQAIDRAVKKNNIKFIAEA